MASPRRTNGLIRDFGQRVSYDAKDIRGTNGSHIYTRAPQFFDHFMLPQTMATNWVDTKTGTGTFAILNSGMGGIAEIATSGASGDSNLETLIMSGSTGSGFNPSKNALERPLTLEARAFIPTATSIEVVVGWTDSTGRAAAGGINYAISAASAVATSVASDAAAFVWSTVPTSGALNGNLLGAVTSVAGTDTVSAISKAGSTVAMDTVAHTFRVDVDVNGAAYFYLDDAAVKFVNGALTANTALYPFFQVTTRTAAVRKLDIDYVLVGSGLAATVT